MNAIHWLTEFQSSLLYALAMFFWLLVGHALCDYPLQGPFLSQAKRRGAVPDFPWWIALAAHGLIHAGAVGFITGNICLGIAEGVCHFVIDKVKCDGHISTVTDQTLHVACKIIWVTMAWLYTDGFTHY